MIYKIVQEYTSMKLIDVLKDQMAFSSRMIRLFKREKRVSVNGIVISFNANLRIGDEVQVDMPVEENIFPPEPIPIEILYEDEHYIVVNKQPFVVVHPTKGHPEGTIANGLAQYMLDQGDSYKIRFANRLDRDTSGAMVICKDSVGQKLISDQMHDNSILKQYIGIVEGHIEGDQGTIDEPIDRMAEDSIERVVRDDGYHSITHYEVIERFSNATMILITLETGRTHQIRVHFRHIGHPLLGDTLYGQQHDSIERQALHAVKLVFKNASNKTITVEAPLKEDMTMLLEKLRLK